MLYENPAFYYQSKRRPERTGALSPQGDSHMDIRFIWVGSTSTFHRDVLESQIRKDLDEARALRPCYAGIVTAYLDSPEPLEVSVTGALICKCGKCLATFSGDTDGSRLTWEEYSG